MRHQQDETIVAVADVGFPRTSSFEETPRFARGTREIERLERAAVDPADDLLDNVEHVIHDLRGPLQTLTLEACLLDDNLSPDDLENRAAVARISRNILFLDRMLQDLADSHSIETGRFELRRQPTELRALIAQTIDRVVSTRDRARVLLEAPSPLVVSIDALRIERVFANFLQNALKYTPRTSRIAIRIDVHGERVRISVIDAGPGMSIEETAHVFDKYRRGKSAAGHEGSGLGLYISKQIVEAHGGTIGATSVEGIGSLFFFDLRAI